MCGIVGYVGKHQAAPIILDGLSKKGVENCLKIVEKCGILCKEFEIN